MANLLPNPNAAQQHGANAAQPEADVVQEMSLRATNRLIRLMRDTNPVESPLEYNEMVMRLIGCHRIKLRTRNDVNFVAGLKIAHPGWQFEARVTTEALQDYALTLGILLLPPP